jgi:hypothetical protein
MVLGRANALEAESPGDFRLRRRQAVGFDALGDHREDGVLGVGEFHGV